jgi:hypothetical protein
MASWDLLASPKCVWEGLGFTNTRVMNHCLLAKWIFKIENNEDNICCNLLRRKYFGERGFFSYKNTNCSQFWKGLLEVKEQCRRGLAYVLGNGKKIRFWHDVWIEGCPLKISFPNLFEICNQQDWSVHRILVDGSPKLSFRRIFGLREEKEWLELSQILEAISLTDDKDSVRWVLEKAKTFSTASLYRELTFSGFTNKWLLCVWRAKLPLKIRVFLWQVFNDKIQSAVHLKGGIGQAQLNANCVAVRNPLSIFFFRCVVS